MIGWWTYDRLRVDPSLYAIDFTYCWNAARYLIAGDNPYWRMPPGAYPVSGPLLYPLPTAIITAPLAWLPVQVAGAVFNGLSAMLLAYALARRAYWQLMMFLSPSYVLAYYNIQWSPLMVAATMLPWLSSLAIAKPNLGLVVAAARPNWWLFGGTVFFGVLSLLFIPHWPLDWWHALHQQRTQHTPALIWPLGAAGLIGLLRWRQPESRILAVLTLVPTSAVPYDHLFLWLIPRTWWQSLLLTATAWLGWLVLLATGPHDLTRSPTMAHFLVALGIYVPAALMVWLGPPTGLSFRDPVDASGPTGDRA